MRVEGCRGGMGGGGAVTPACARRAGSNSGRDNVSVIFARASANVKCQLALCVLRRARHAANSCVGVVPEVGRKQQEEIGCTVAIVLVVVTRRLASPHRLRRPRLRDELLRRFVEADLRARSIVQSRAGVARVCHRGACACACA